jgi:uncharacterized membrane protein
LGKKYCLKCGKELPDDAIYCLNCGTAVSAELAKRRSGLLTAGGVLVIIDSCIVMVTAILGLIASVGVLSAPQHYSNTGIYYNIFIVSLFEVLCFAFGLTAGIQSLRRKTFVISIIGIVFLMVAGILDLVYLGIPYGGALWFFLLFGGTTLILSLLGLIFVAIKKQDFT